MSTSKIIYSSLYKRMLSISRPRFWMYTIGPYLLGTVAGLTSVLDNPLIFSWMVLPSYLQLIWWLWLLYFTFPANFLIYGVNDIRDYETDKHNPKKQHYETLVTPKKHNDLTRVIVRTTIPFLLVFLWAVVYQASLLQNMTYAVSLMGALALFVFLWIFYSAKPIRAKAIPFVDGIFNFLYVVPGIISFLLVRMSWVEIDGWVLLAALFWVMAMHAYSAVPDIQADNAAWIPTVATLLTKDLTLLYCLLLYSGAAFLTFDYLQYVGVAIGAIYGLMMIASMFVRDIFALYRWFPLINTLLWFAIFIFLAFF